MRRITVTLIAFSLLAAPAAAFAQARPERPAPAQVRPLRAPGVQIADHVLAYREELGLTAQQVERIRTLRNQHMEQIRPVIEQLRAQRPELRNTQRAQQLRERTRMQRDSMQSRLRSMSAEEREAMRQRLQDRRGQRQLPEELRASLENLRTSHRAFLEQVNAVLTPEQREKLRELRPGRIGR